MRARDPHPHAAQTRANTRKSQLLTGTTDDRRSTIGPIITSIGRRLATNKQTAQSIPYHFDSFLVPGSSHADPASSFGLAVQRPTERLTLGARLVRVPEWLCRLIAQVP